MKRAIIKSFIVFLIFFSFPSKTLATFEKISQPNNKIGIHLAVASEEDLKDAANLVNSSGDWGYVTLVIEETDRNKDKWQGVFDLCRQLHLIPIVRLATSVEGDSWRRPELKDVGVWVDFLNSLNWVIKNRYIVLFNEPNHGKEWGGSVDPEHYAQVAFEFAKTLKEAHPDFFVMLSGFDAAAPQVSPHYFDEENFLRRVFAVKPELLDYLDGWASHSYPNHGYVGSPTGQGRNSVLNYLWELNLLRDLGVRKDLPVFITETGWPHREGINEKNNFFSALEVEKNLDLYFEKLINDSKVVAITPFVLNYQGEPFDHFSWRKLGEPKTFYPQYQLVQQIDKVKGEPQQVQRLAIVSKLPAKLTKSSTYQIPIQLRNEGQAIWSRKEGYEFQVLGEGERIDYFVSDFSEIFPFEEETAQLFLKTGGQLQRLDLKLAIAKDGKIISNEIDWSLEVVPLINLNFKVNLYQKRESLAKDLKFLIYNPQEEVVFERSQVEVRGGKGRIEDINNLVIGEKYRLVILKPYYLPRQTFLTVQENENKTSFEAMLPLDFNLDGKFSWEDGLALLRNPRLLKLWWMN